MGKGAARILRHERIRKRVIGTEECPRLCVSRSLKNLSAQLVDDVKRQTLMGFSTLSKEFKDKKNAGNVKGAVSLGKQLAKKALEKKIVRVVFDRGGFLYHGRVKAFADGAREGGLKF